MQDKFRSAARAVCLLGGRCDDLYIYIYIRIYVCVCMCMHVCVYIYRERERGIHIYIYIYIICRSPMPSGDVPHAHSPLDRIPLGIVELRSHVDIR